jgi:hypothetical protein
MLPLLVNLLPDNMSGAAKTPATTAAPIPVVTAPDTVPSIRTQLANAVAAPGALAAYAAQTPQPLKPTLRALSSQTSSQLAAQYIAQTPEADNDDLKIFATRQRSDTDPQVDDEEPSTGDDFLAQLRLARGDPAPSSKTPAPASAPSSAQAASEAASVITNANATNAIRAGRAALTGLAAALSSQFISRLPKPVLTSGAKKPGLGQVRGSSAYQLTTTRNNTKAPTVMAVL